MPALSRRQITVLALITLVWGINWPVMKLGVTGFAPLTFRTLSLGLGLPLLAVVLRVQRMPFAVPRSYWLPLMGLGLANMVVWHVLAILAIPELSSGRAAILGYTMPIFSAVLGAAVFGERLVPRAWAGVAAAAAGVLLLLWHELSALGGRPVGVLLMLSAASGWALGTQLLRRSAIPVPTLTLSFWMTVQALAVLIVLAVLFERDRWVAPTPPVWGAVLYNAVLAFGFAQPAWFSLARGLPPVASTLSVMFIPVLGVFSGAVWLSERLHWQDGAAMALMVAAIASVLWPGRPPRR